MHEICSKIKDKVCTKYHMMHKYAHKKNMQYMCQKICINVHLYADICIICLKYVYRVNMQLFAKKYAELGNMQKYVIPRMH